MRADKKPSVLVCVTGQYDCDRLIEVGFEQASALDCDLHVLCVHTPMNDISRLSDEIEYLYRTAKELGADMTIAFDKNAPKFAAGFARKINARHLVTGMPDNGARDAAAPADHDGNKRERYPPVFRRLHGAFVRITKLTKLSLHKTHNQFHQYKSRLFWRLLSCSFLKKKRLEVCGNIWYYITNNANIGSEGLFLRPIHRSPCVLHDSKPERSFAICAVFAALPANSKIEKISCKK